MAPGTYTVRVSFEGFKSAAAEAVAVEASKTTTVNLKLEVGAFTEVVTVESAAAPVNTVDAQVATNVGEKHIQELRSYSRNVLTFATLQAGVEVGTSQIAGGSQNLNILGTCAFGLRPATLSFESTPFSAPRW